MGKCKGKNKNGKNCGKYALKDKEYCQFHINEKLNDNCPICLESEGDLYPLSCLHHIHLDCCEGLLKLQCPICRAEIINLPPSIVKTIEANANKYKDECDEESRQNIIRHLRTNTNVNTQQLEAASALNFLHEFGIPHNYIPQLVYINLGQESPRPPPGVIFETIIGQSIERIKERLISDEIDDEALLNKINEYQNRSHNENSNNENSDEEDIYDIFPDEEENENIIRTIRINPE